jgi:hypothetical protein
MDPQIQYVKMTAADLAATLNGTAKRVDLPFEADFIILPPAVPVAAISGIAPNGNPALIYNIQINDQANATLMFGSFPLPSALANSGVISAFVGKIRTIFVAVNLATGVDTVDVVFLVGKNCKIGTASQVFHT